MRTIIITAIITVTGFAVPAFATIINIPADYPTIQTGINASTDGDTVLVQPGTYVENINFNGHSIVLGSLFLTTGDTSYISTTIIDGDSTGSVVTFENGEDSTAVIAGFTMQNARYGVYCYQANPTILKNKIKHIDGVVIFCRFSDATIIDNEISDNHDAYAIYSDETCDLVIRDNRIFENNLQAVIVCNSASPIITNNIIRDNNAVGISCYDESEPTINNNLIVNNRQGIYCVNGARPVIQNNTICFNNGASYGGGIRISHSDPVIINNIFWGNGADNDGNNIYVEAGFPEISYCDIQDTLWPGRGNVSVEPLFRDTLNHDYHLMSTGCRDSLDSPCIDMGSPAIIDSLLDCSWGLGAIASDMGAFSGGDTTIVNTNVINVPGDYPTIQLAIDASYEGDTVLVQPDSYFENINFDGHNVVVGSMYMMTGDISYISSTIIDGDGIGSVITIDSGENYDARIVGFTIQNGSANHGGGIYCQESHPIISNNIIKDNEAGSFGAGVLCLGSSSIIKNNLFTGNIANQGGAICCMESNPSIVNNTMAGNIADLSGGAIYCSLVSNPLIINTIMWDDSAAYEPEIDFDDSSSPIISYSNIQGGWSGDGNIDTDPFFRDPENGDFHLMSTGCGDPYDSPCIDTGDPSIEDILLDCQWGLGTEISDMGAYGGGELIMVGIDDDVADLPDKFSLLHNYPNPFNPSTTIRYSLPEQSDVRIEIYNILGQRVATLFDGNKQAGYHTITWQANDYPSGVYFARLETGTRSESIKMVLLK